MTGGFIKKKYNRMYISMLLSWTVVLVGSLSDSIIGGIFISEDAVSATGLVQPIFSLVIFIANLLAVGSSSKFSNYAGAFDKENAGKVAGIGLLFSIAAGAFVALMMVVLREPFFNTFAVSAEVEGMAREYYNCFILLMLIYPAYFTLYYLVSIDGDDRRMLESDIIMAVCNAGLSLLLVQKIGIKGLALGTIFSTLIGMIPVALHYFSKSNSVTFNFKIEPKLVKEIVISGSTMSMTQLYIAVIDIIMNKFVIDNFGSSYLAVYAVVNLILNLGQISSCAADAAASFVGVSYGENNPKGLRKILRICTTRTVITSTSLMVLFLIIADKVPAIYGITTPELVTASVYVTRVLALSYPAIGFVYEWIGYLPKIEKPALGNLIAFVYMLAAPLTFPLIFTAPWGFHGFIWGFFTAPFVAVAVASVYIIVRYGKKAFPFAISENDSIIFIHEYAFEQQELAVLRETLRGEMKSAGLPDGLANKVEMVLEETTLIVAEKNKTKKQILGDCTLIITADTVNMITRDNGELFDITQEVEESATLRHYVAARMISDSREAAYLATISFNRNSFVWNR